MQSPEVSIPRNSDSVTLRSNKDICILGKYCQFHFLQVVCNFGKHRPRDLGGVGEGGSGKSVWKDETRDGWEEFGLYPGGEPSRVSKQGSDGARSVMEINCSYYKAQGIFSLLLLH